MSTYAAGARTEIDKTRLQIERVLLRYGANKFVYATDEDAAIAQIGFQYDGRNIRLLLPLFSTADFAKTNHKPPRNRTPAEQVQARDQANRERWRALLLIVTAKLEAIKSGIVSFDKEFAVDTVTEDGRTVWEHYEPQLKQIYASGRVPPLIPGGEPRRITGEVL